MANRTTGANLLTTPFPEDMIITNFTTTNNNSMSNETFTHYNSTSDDTPAMPGLDLAMLVPICVVICIVVLVVAILCLYNFCCDDASDSTKYWINGQEKIPSSMKPEIPLHGFSNSTFSSFKQLTPTLIQPGKAKTPAAINPTFVHHATMPSVTVSPLDLPDLVQSYPNLCVASSQAPFSPHRLTWLPKESLSEPSIWKPSTGTKGPPPIYNSKVLALPYNSNFLAVRNAYAYKKFTVNPLAAMLSMSESSHCEKQKLSGDEASEQYFTSPYVNIRSLESVATTPQRSIIVNRASRSCPRHYGALRDRSSISCPNHIGQWSYNNAYRQPARCLLHLDRSHNITAELSAHDLSQAMAMYPVSSDKLSMLVNQSTTLNSNSSIIPNVGSCTDSLNHLPQQNDTAVDSLACNYTLFPRQQQQQLSTLERRDWSVYNASHSTSLDAQPSHSAMQSDTSSCVSYIRQGEQTHIGGVEQLNEGMLSDSTAESADVSRQTATQVSHPDDDAEQAVVQGDLECEAGSKRNGTAVSNDADCDYRGSAVEPEATETGPVDDFGQSEQQTSQNECNTRDDVGHDSAKDDQCQKICDGVLQSGVANPASSEATTKEKTSNHNVIEKSIPSSKSTNENEDKGRINEGFEEDFIVTPQKPLGLKLVTATVNMTQNPNSPINSTLLSTSNISNTRPTNVSNTSSIKADDTSSTFNNVVTSAITDTATTGAAGSWARGRSKSARYGQENVRTSRRCIPKISKASAKNTGQTGNTLANTKRVGDSTETGGSSVGYFTSEHRLVQNADFASRRPSLPILKHRQYWV